MMRWFEHHQVYHPSRFMAFNGTSLGRPMEDVYFETSDRVRLNGWFFPAATNSPRASLVVLLCHGNAGNISYRLDMCGALLSTGVNVFMLDYRGYGRSRGRPSEEGTYLDGLAAQQWLEKKGFAASNILVYGESLGGAVGAELAARGIAGGLVLQATFTSMPDIGSEFFPWLPVRWLGTIHYDTLSKLPRIKVPVLVMHSRGDRLVGFHHAERNFAAANEPKLFCELKGGHNDAVLHPRVFLEGMEKFLRLVEAAKGQTVQAR
jgi:fermentation-respiration switch protein FrsA (DUF1100 family)